jgi:peptidoglycan hydrolase-like protein with peptidoglycan-binding domain/3D (Asp-Asp-Asp) domain-containing protein
MFLKRFAALSSLALFLGIPNLISYQAYAIEAENEAQAQAADAQTAEAPVLDYYVQNFIISAYYSPLPGQNRYATGSYEADIRLNGNGTNGADGTPVYPGMIAAPKTYAFGTKLEIPGIGLVTVHDRGGAIVPAGQRGHAYDRLDVWMGYGDDGLLRALQWGKRTVETKVYGVRPELKDEVYLSGYSETERFVQNTLLAPLNFPNDLDYGSSSDSVKKMQEHLLDWGYLTEASGFYGDETAQALLEFQIDFGIVDDASELGAGHFGLKTRTQFDKLLKSEEEADAIVSVQRGKNLLAKYPDLDESPIQFGQALGLGDSGDQVRLLQEELSSIGFFRAAITGEFGEVTEHAVFKFQQSQGLVQSLNDSGAGYFGPNTRAALNGITDSRYSMKSQLALQRQKRS